MQNGILFSLVGLLVNNRSPTPFLPKFFKIRSSNPIAVSHALAPERTLVIEKNTTAVNANVVNQRPCRKNKWKDLHPNESSCALLIQFLKHYIL